MRLTLLVAVLFGLISVAVADRWAVVIAGSETFSNYRHQADAYAAVQLLRANGIPDSNLIVVHKDDIAHNSANPFPGQVFNWPGGPNVYVNIPKDLTGNLVTVPNVLKLLSGADMKGIGSGKSLKPTANDDVFIFFTDHGTTNAVAIMNDLLYASDLLDALSKLQYKQLVFYMEACESGSMFYNQKKLTNAYLVTAANPTESSWACDLDEKVGTYLNDCFSNMWMNSSRRHAADATYTFEAQYNEIQPLVTQSHVCQYGDLDMTSEAMSIFIGAKTARNFDILSGSQRPVSRPGIDTRMATFDYLERQLEIATGARRDEIVAEYQQHLRMRSTASRVFAAIDSKFPRTARKNIKVNTADDPSCYVSAVQDAQCLREAQQAYIRVCGNGKVNDYAMMEFKRLATHCDGGVKASQLEEVMTMMC